MSKSKRPIVWIDKPCSPESSEKVFGYTPERKQKLLRMIDQALLGKTIKQKKIAAK